MAKSSKIIGDKIALITTTIDGVKVSQKVTPDYTGDVDAALARKAKILKANTVKAAEKKTKQSFDLKAFMQ